MNKVKLKLLPVPDLVKVCQVALELKSSCWWITLCNLLHILPLRFFKPHSESRKCYNSKLYSLIVQFCEYFVLVQVLIALHFCDMTSKFWKFEVFVIVNSTWKCVSYKICRHVYNMCPQKFHLFSFMTESKKTDLTDCCVYLHCMEITLTVDESFFKITYHRKLQTAVNNASIVSFQHFTQSSC